MVVALLTVLYVVVSVFLILVVLLQTGKRADLAGAFGGGGSQTAFGTRGAATLLTKLTTGSAVAFMVLALTLAILTSKNGGPSGSVLEDVEAPPTTGAPAPTDLDAPPAGVPATAPVEPAEDATDTSGETDQP